MNTEDHRRLQTLLEQARRVVIIQADNPDGDSLASSLALEEILGEMDKEVYLYCGVDMPDYLKHLKGWDRVTHDIPSQFDMSIIVDTSALILLEKLEHSSYRGPVSTRPVVVIDHHAEVACDIPYATVVINDKSAVATGEAIFKLAKRLDWPLTLPAKTHIASSILADSLGLSSEGTTADTYRIMAELIDGGVDRPVLEEARRAFMKMPEAIFRYKARLIERCEFYHKGRVAVVTIPDKEIREYSPLYNPAPLIQNDMLQTEGVEVAIVLKQYSDGKTTGSIRCNSGAQIAGALATEFGGGGHPYAAGFKITDKRTHETVKSEVIRRAGELLATLGKSHETL